MRSVNRTFSGLTKLIFPSGEMQKEDARLLLNLALELRLRVRLQLNRINAQEFPLTEFSYRDRGTGEHRGHRRIAPAHDFGRNA